MDWAPGCPFRFGQLGVVEIEIEGGGKSYEKVNKVFCFVASSSSSMIHPHPHPYKLTTIKKKHLIGDNRAGYEAEEASLPVGWPTRQVKWTEGSQSHRRRPVDLSSGGEKGVRVRTGGDYIILRQRVGDVNVRLEDLRHAHLQVLQATVLVRLPGELLVDPDELQDDDRFKDGGGGVLERRERN